MAIINGRVTAAHIGPVVVFVLGMRINALWRLDQWLPVARAMPRMLAELTARPDSGLLAHQFLLAGPRTLTTLQYWRDFASLEAYARDRDAEHWPAWVAFNKAVGASGTVGIFHETYSVPAGGFETIYANMPAWGLAKVAGTAPATGSRNTARERMRANPEE